MTASNQKPVFSLPESEQRYRLIVEQAGDAFFIHDYSGRIIDINQQACDSLGYTLKELTVLNIGDVDTEIKKKNHQHKFWEKLTPGKYITFEGSHRRKDGGTFPVEVRLGRLDFGKKQFLLSLVRDISDRKKNEDKLKQAFSKIKMLKDQLEQENIYLRKEINLSHQHEAIIGESNAIWHALAKGEKVAAQDTCVLLLGETGTGKELLAQAIHTMSLRRERPMVKVNCAALPSNLIESELFGHHRGAFTGAHADRPGKFELANNGTLFLDEVGDLPLELQSKLLRALQEGEIERLGGTKTLKVNVRIIAATNQDLKKMVRKGTFRKDLYYRLNVFPITVPALRERNEDIPALVSAFVKEFSQTMGKPIPKILKRTMDRLVLYPWSGNVRELRNIIERAMIMTTGDTLNIEPPDPTDAAEDLKLTLDDVDRVFDSAFKGQVLNFCLVPILITRNQLYTSRIFLYIVSL